MKHIANICINVNAVSLWIVYKIGEDLMENLSVNEHKENEAVI